MNEEKRQEENNELSPEEAKASLGLSTRLSEQFLQAQAMQQAQMMGEEAQQDPTEAPVEPQEARTEELAPEVEEEAVEEENIGIEAIQEAVRTAVQEEMKGLKKDIEKAINEDEN